MTVGKHFLRAKSTRVLSVYFVGFGCSNLWLSLRHFRWQAPFHLKQLQFCSHHLKSDSWHFKKANSKKKKKKKQTVAAWVSEEMHNRSCCSNQERFLLAELTSESKAEWWLNQVYILWDYSSWKGGFNKLPVTSTLPPSTKGFEGNNQINSCQNHRVGCCQQF